MSIRIISGERRGAKLDTPEGPDTRPLRDRIREALFSVLRPELRGLRVLDCFAGTGAVGLEALSNFASHAIFIEPLPAAQNMIARNITKLRYQDRSVLLKGYAPQAFSDRAMPKSPIDVVFLMPPYHTSLGEDVLAAPELQSLLASNALAVHEVHKDQIIAAIPGWELTESREYGITILRFLRWRPA